LFETGDLLCLEPAKVGGGSGLETCDKRKTGGLSVRHMIGEKKEPPHA
jgi:hypothetical protein